MIPSGPILVTGAGGFLGQAVVECLIELDRRIIPVFRPGSDKPAQAVTCDLSSPSSVWRLLANHKPGTIVNCAVLADFEAGALSRQYPVNTLLPGVLAAWTAEQSGYLVQVSMSGIHGARTELIKQDSPILLDTDYARGKFLADELIAASGCRAGILRFGGIYGSRGPSHLGLNRAIDDARSGEVPTLVGTGRSKRNYIHVRDAASMIRFSIENSLSGAHLSGGSEILSIREMLHLVCKTYLGGQEPIQSEGRDAADQIVESSPALPATRPMSQCLAEEI